MQTWECNCNNNINICQVCSSHYAAKKQDDAEYSVRIGKMEQANAAAMPPQVVDAPSDAEPAVQALNDPAVSTAIGRWDDMFAVQDLKGIEEPTFDVMARFNEMMTERQ